MNELRYNDVSMKGSHNSYQRDETITEQITWNVEKNYNCGCGELELDITQSSEDNRWSVGHLPFYSDNKEDQLAVYLGKLTQWSQQNPGHDVITLYLDLKSTASGNFPSELDSYIKENFPVDIFQPGVLFGNAPNLSQGVLENGGFPRVEILQGKFLICLTGDSGDKGAYARTEPEARVCFADKDMPCNQMPTDAHRVFFNYHIYHNNRDEWMPVFKKNIKTVNAVIRAYIANSKDNWNDCFASGCNIIATDKISNHSWAEVGSNRFVKLKGL